MHLHFGDEDEAFRLEVAGWLEQRLGGEFAAVRGCGGSGDAHARIDERRAWERELGAAGWTCLGWPREYGGRGASLEQQLIFHEEYARAGGPGRLGHMGEGLLGPTLIAFGTEEQKRRFLPPIVKGEEIWCQGYSEPGAGSDLANVQARARLEGSEWVIDGQKVWTSWAQWSDWCFALCRTDPSSRRHQGLSYLLIPMRQPGLEIRPIVQITGDSEFSEVFFDDVKLPQEWLVGVKNRGWYQVAVALDFERSGSSGPAAARRVLEEVVKWAKRARRNGQAVTKEPAARAKLAEIALEIEVGRSLCYRVASMQSRGLVPNYEASVARMFYAEMNQRFMKAVMEMMGLDGQLGRNQPWSQMRGRFVYNYLRSIGNTIETGTSEIQRNIIAERGLGLPRG